MIHHHPNLSPSPSPHPTQPTLHCRLLNDAEKKGARLVLLELEGNCNKPCPRRRRSARHGLKVSWSARTLSWFGYVECWRGTPGVWFYDNPKSSEEWEEKMKSARDMDQDELIDDGQWLFDFFEQET